MFSIPSPRETSNNLANLHQIHTYPWIALMLEVGNDSVCGKQINWEEEAAEKKKMVDEWF